MDATRSGGDGMPDEIPNDCGLPSTTVHTYILYHRYVCTIFFAWAGGFAFVSVHAFTPRSHADLFSRMCWMCI